jgi:phosphoglycerol transferase MdoB-like AlkP superfamily enzyme
VQSAEKPPTIVILSEAKDFALSILELGGERLTEDLRDLYREQTPYQFDQAQSKVLRFAQDDS